MCIALRLAKEGYYGGDPRRVLKAPVQDVLMVENYLIFGIEYEAAEVEINKE